MLDYFLKSIEYNSVFVRLRAMESRGTHQPSCLNESPKHTMVFTQPSSCAFSGDMHERKPIPSHTSYCRATIPTYVVPYPC